MQFGSLQFKEMKYPRYLSTGGPESAYEYRFGDGWKIHILITPHLIKVRLLHKNRKMSDCHISVGRSVDWDETLKTLTENVWSRTLKEIEQRKKMTEDLYDFYTKDFYLKKQV